MKLARLGIAVLALSAPAVAVANAVDGFLAFTASSGSATAKFEQQVFDRSGKQVERSTGEFAFMRPGKFRWAYDKPLASLIVADGTRLWIYDEDLRQVTVRPMDRALSATPAALLAGQADVTAVFTLRDAGNAAGLDWLEAVPRERDTGFERVRIGMRGRLPAAMELQDSLGGRTVLRFTDFRTGTRIAGEAFQFVPPKGTDVLNEMPPAGADRGKP